MRKALTILLSTAALAGIAAQPAAADDPNATSGTGIGYYAEDGYRWSATAYCRTPGAMGVFGANGAWAWYVDGCTTPKLTCKRSAESWCTVKTWTSFDAREDSVYRVTQNARTRVYRYLDGWGGVVRYEDRSCDRQGANCTTSDWFDVPGGRSVSAQCNGVQGIYSLQTVFDIRATNYCSVRIY